MKSLLCLFALSIPAFGAVSINLPGATETASWTLSTPNYSGFNSFPTAANPWSTSAAGVGTASALLNKISGSGYITSGFMYTAGTNGGFRLYDESPQASLQTIVFQGKISDVFNAAPILNLNGGSQAIVPTFSAIAAGTGYPDRVWQWDLSSVGAITSYEILFDGHFAANSLQIDTGSTFTALIPEPSTSLLGAAAMGLAFIRRRRA
ncbi:MAG: PEP-CTERM sorting domain-containing protein [Verrucomicrobiaceae bacterium]|nr:MAG: PEP-CTERM sorting domain-containing protein [Verrucomicrobiaceae bacterium]